MKTLSIVTPCYNEEGGIADCYEAVRRVMAGRLAHLAYEHIFIDNDSKDRTVEILRGLAARDPRVRIIVNARNFGPARSPHHAMLEAGGDAVIPVLADLQTPPELIPEMVELWAHGYRIVVAQRRRSAEPRVSRLVRAAFYRMMRSLSRIEQIPNFMGFGLYDRVVMDALRGLNEPEPYFRGLVSEIGFKRAIVEYDQPERVHGASKNSFLDLIDYAILAVTSYSRAPLRLMTLGGLAVAALSFCIGMGYLVAKLMFWNSLPLGVAPVLIAVFFLGAAQICALGVVGEYVGLLLSYARRFPLVIERERINFGEGIGATGGPEAYAGIGVRPGQQARAAPAFVDRGRVSGTDISHAGTPEAATT